MTQPEQSAQDDGTRSIDQSVEVQGTVEEVWQAVATGPGISSWFVPTTVEEREGGATTSEFGPGEEMLIHGRVRVWDPPHRVVFDGGDADEGLAFEWLVEARDGGTCIVRLINSGFGSGDEWDGQYDGMDAGWRMFLHNLQLHLSEFGGRNGVAILPMTMAAGSVDEIWATLAGTLGIPTDPRVGDHVVATGGATALAGTVRKVAPGLATLVLDQPTPGTALLAVEGGGGQAAVSVWLYVYGPDAAERSAGWRDAWQAWLADLFPAPD